MPPPPRYLLCRLPAAPRPRRCPLSSRRRCLHPLSYRGYLVCLSTAPASRQRVYLLLPLTSDLPRPDSPPNWVENRTHCALSPPVCPLSDNLTRLATTSSHRYPGTPSHHFDLCTQLQKNTLQEALRRLQAPRPRLHPFIASYTPCCLLLDAVSGFGFMYIHFLYGESHTTYVGPHHFVVFFC